jgi:hypothetical protein
MVLIPEHQFLQRTNRDLNAIIAPIENNEVVRLDEEMTTILDRKDINVQEKSKLYNDVLQKYLSLLDKVKQGMRTPQHIHEDTSNAYTKSTENNELNEVTSDRDLIEEQIIDSTSVNNRKKARAIIKMLKTKKHLLHWNKNGNMIYKGVTLPDTQIVDNFNSIMKISRAGKSENDDVIGMSDFIQALTESSIPEVYIVNKTQRRQLRERKLSKMTSINSPVSKKRRRENTSMTLTDVRHSPKKTKSSKANINNSLIDNWIMY